MDFRFGQWAVNDCPDRGTSRQNALHGRVLQRPLQAPSAELLDREHGSSRGAVRVLYGQEIQPESYAVCRSDMLLKGQDASKIVFGDTLTADGFPTERFDYMLANPPYGKDWPYARTT